MKTQSFFVKKVLVALVAALLAVSAVAVAPAQAAPMPKEMPKNQPVILPAKIGKSTIKSEKSFKVVEKAYNNGKLVADIGKAWKSNLKIDLIKKKVKASCTFTVKDGKNFSSSSKKAAAMAKQCKNIVLKKGVKYIENARLLGDGSHLVWKESVVGTKGNTLGMNSLLLYKEKGSWKSSICTNTIWLSKTKPKSFVRTYTQSQKGTVNVRISGKTTVKRSVTQQGYCSLNPEFKTTATADATASLSWSATVKYAFSAKNKFKLIAKNVYGDSIAVARSSRVAWETEAKAAQMATERVRVKLKITCAPPTPPTPCKWNPEITADDENCHPDNPVTISVEINQPSDVHVGENTFVYATAWVSNGERLNSADLDLKSNEAGVISAQTGVEPSTCAKFGLTVESGAVCVKAKFTAGRNAGTAKITAVATKVLSSKTLKTEKSVAFLVDAQPVRN